MDRSGIFSILEWLPWFQSHYFVAASFQDGRTIMKMRIKESLL